MLLQGQESVFKGKDPLYIHSLTWSRKDLLETLKVPGVS